MNLKAVTQAVLFELLIKNIVGIAKMDILSVI